jgi:hypothetical protein
MSQTLTGPRLQVGSETRPTGDEAMSIDRTVLNMNCFRFDAGVAKNENVVGRVCDVGEHS